MSEFGQLIDDRKGAKNEMRKMIGQLAIGNGEGMENNAFERDKPKKFT
jgi:hypothetical protein